MTKTYRVAVDVGGTFTDLVSVDSEGEYHLSKVPTTYPDPQRGVSAAIELAGIEFKDIELFLHGFTLATNAVIMRKGAKTGLVGTKGFRDMLEIRRANRSRDGMYDINWDPPKPLVPRRNRLTVSERVDYKGRVIEPLNEEEARSVGRAFRKRGVESIAVSFLNSFLCPDNELAMAEILREECPGAFISLSSQLIPVIYEFERTSTTVVNAYLEPIVRNYMGDLEAEFRSQGYRGEMLIMLSSGGTATPEGAAQTAARTIMSGPAAGVVAAKNIGELIGENNLISFDMGGTSADIATIYRGNIGIAEESKIEFGVPVVFPTIDLVTIGAGGGTIATVDDAGVLKSGPESAGSSPGPACYGAGGKNATNTDANLLLGALNPEALAGGNVKLDRTLAESVIKPLGEKLGMDVIRTADGIITVSNANMVQAIRQMTTERGFDPRDYAMVSFGGAGGLHCADIATQMKIPRIIVPAHPGITSALGLLFSDVRYDFSQTYIKRADQIDCDFLEKQFRALEERGREMLEAAGFGQDSVRFRRIANFKYYGGFEAVPTSVEISAGYFDSKKLDEALAVFSSEHEREYNYVLEDIPVELQTIRVIASGVIDTPTLPLNTNTSSKEDAWISDREVYFRESDAFVKTPVYARDKLGPNNFFEGPAIFEQMDSTILLRPGMTAEIDMYSNLIMTTAKAD